MYIFMLTINNLSKYLSKADTSVCTFFGKLKQKIEFCINRKKKDWLREISEASALNLLIVDKR